MYNLVDLRRSRMRRFPVSQRGFKQLNPQYIEVGVQEYVLKRHYDVKETYLPRYQDNQIWTDTPSKEEKDKRSPSNHSRAKSASPSKLWIQQVIVDTTSKKEGSNATPSTPSNRGSLRQNPPKDIIFGPLFLRIPQYFLIVHHGPSYRPHAGNVHFFPPTDNQRCRVYTT